MTCLCVCVFIFKTKISPAISHFKTSLTKQHILQLYLFKLFQYLRPFKGVYIFSIFFSFSKQIFLHLSYYLVHSSLNSLIISSKCVIQKMCLYNLKEMFFLLERMSCIFLDVNSLVRSFLMSLFIFHFILLNILLLWINI